MKQLSKNELIQLVDSQHRIKIERLVQHNGTTALVCFETKNKDLPSFGTPVRRVLAVGPGRTFTLKEVQSGILSGDNHLGEPIAYWSLHEKG